MTPSYVRLVFVGRFVRGDEDQGHATLATFARRGHNWDVVSFLLVSRTYERIGSVHGSETGTGVAAGEREEVGNSIEADASRIRLAEAACTKHRNPPRARRFCGPESTLDTLQGALGASEKPSNEHF